MCGFPVWIPSTTTDHVTQQVQDQHLTVGTKSQQCSCARGPRTGGGGSGYRGSWTVRHAAPSMFAFVHTSRTPTVATLASLARSFLGILAMSSKDSAPPSKIHFSTCTKNAQPKHEASKTLNALFSICIDALVPHALSPPRARVDCSTG